MRTISFRDGVLYPTAFKVGLDPKRDFQSNQMRALVAFINLWVIRLWDKSDFPEWTTIEQRTPVSHIVDYDQIGKTPIGRVLKVFLADPYATNVPVDTPFKLTDLGVHCGYDHGTSVWVKFLQREPQFTADIWDPNRTYNGGELAYLPDTGECYSSMGNNNRGHYPGFVGQRQPIQTEITQQATMDNPGLAQRPEIMIISYTTLSVPPDPPNIPVSGSVFNIGIYDANQNVIGNSFHTANGIETLGAIITAQAADLVATLPGTFVVTPDTVNKKITLQNLSVFTTAYAWYEQFSPQFIYHPLGVTIQQSYVPPVGATTGLRQYSTVTLTADLVIPTQVYYLTFVDQSGLTHEVNYTAIAGDNVLQVLSGLISAITAAQAIDSFFNTVVTSIDTVSLRLIVSTPAQVTVDASFGRRPLPPTPVPPVPVPPSYWIYVPFPHDLALQVGRGAYSDYLKMEGQTDKGAAEEQGALGEQGELTGTKVAPPYDALTDQQPPGVPRYRGAG